MRENLMPKIDLKKSQAFWGKIKQNSCGCWIWQGSLSGKYGKSVWKVDNVRKHFLSHRVAYFLYYLQDPKASLVCHRCDTPLCVNPLHLFLGTAKDNSMDMVNKGRSDYRKGESNPHSKLIEDNIRQIRQMYANGESQSKIATFFGIGTHTVSRIVNYKRWSHI